MSCGLRDVLEFERVGRPAVLVASSVFAETLERQATALGQPGARRLLVAHPIQDRSDEELAGLAAPVAERLLAELGRDRPAPARD